MGDDTDLRPLDRLGNDGMHLLLGPSLHVAMADAHARGWTYTAAVFGVLFIAWVILAAGKQFFDGWRPGSGRRADAALDFVLVLWGSGLIAYEVPGAWVSIAMAGLATVILRALQEELAR